MSDIGTVKKRVDVHYLNRLFMGKSAAVGVLEHFNFVSKVLKKKQNFTSFL